ncbi:hypothetical protein AAVH_39753 [Aphelenchoides avenae]|nr:hypothetical protein AAVH_39753 [Aphelenchus avenae]
MAFALVAVLALATTAFCRPQNQLPLDLNQFNGAQQVPGVANVQEASSQLQGAGETLKSLGQGGLQMAVQGVQDNLLNQDPSSFSLQGGAEKLQGGVGDLTSGVQMGQAMGEGIAANPAGFFGIDGQKILNAGQQQH